MYLAHEIQQPIPKLRILYFHELFLQNLLICFYLVKAIFAQKQVTNQGSEKSEKYIF